MRTRAGTFSKPKAAEAGWGRSSMTTGIRTPIPVHELGSFLDRLLRYPDDRQALGDATDTGRQPEHALAPSAIGPEERKERRAVEEHGKRSRPLAVVDVYLGNRSPDLDHRPARKSSSAAAGCSPMISATSSV